jgi:putative hydrolase
MLYEISDLLEQQNANPFRVNAYRRAADTVRALQTDVRELIEREGDEGLIKLPHIGTGIARTIHEIVATGRSSRIDSLRGALEPVRLFQSLPGLGPELAERIHDHLQVNTLEALEIAAHDGRLESVPGVGRRRTAAIRASLANMLGRRTWQRFSKPSAEPPIAVLLDVDEEYRHKAKADKLPTIAPRRFNPEGRAWLPVLHAHREHWHFSVLYSNTALAHKLERTHDWVVMYYYDDHHQEGQHTVVTETHGPLTGQRVVRGREAECQDYYTSTPST